VDWFYEPDGNVDWRWELNRHAYFITLGRAYAQTGQARYLETFQRLLFDWLNHNPPLNGSANWASVLEVAYRINAWTWALNYFCTALDDEALLACLRGLWWHGRFLAANLEYASPNNHLWLESKALAILGVLFPEFSTATEWREVGLQVLGREVARQISVDGVHLEQSMLYHRILTSELAELLVVMEDNALTIPAEWRAVFARMLHFEATALKPNDEPPLTGDSALTDSYLRFNARLIGAALLQQADLARGDLDEATLWLIGPERADWLRRNAVSDTPPKSYAFTAGGYGIMRAADRHLIVDCGPFGYPLAPGHGHADALSFELFAHGRTWLVDPGVYSYHLGADWRRFFRGTTAHNTVVIDGQDQTEQLDIWHVRRPAHTRWHHWLSTPDFDLADAEHDGYMRLPQPVTHRRQIVFVKPDYWVIADQLSGSGAHQTDVFFHFSPETHLTLQSGRVCGSQADGAGMSLVFEGPPGVEANVIAGSTAPIQGWVSRHSGEKIPAPVLCLSVNAALPLEFVTVVLPGQIESLRLERLPIQTGARIELDPTQAIALRIVTDAWTDEVIVDRRPVPELKRLSDWQTSARVAGVRRHQPGTTPFHHWVEAGTTIALETLVHN
jgi:hypothetical protein